MKALLAIAGVILLLAVVWASLAVWFDFTRSPWLSGILVAILLAGCAGLLIRVRPFGRAMLAVAGVILFVIVWWNLIPPRNDREWLPDVAQLPRATIKGNQLNVENVRNFDYHTKDDYTPLWETREYDLDKLRGADMFICSWGSPFIVHTITSWDFGNGQHLAVSIETRKEKGESYSAIRGFFRQFEVYYVMADERDVVRLRTNYRGETVRLYHTRVQPEVARALLLDFIAEINQLNEKPQWYNALTCNCTTAIRHHAERIGKAHPWDWRVLLNGNLEKLAYERGTIDTRFPLAELIQISDITQKAKAADGDADFSERIRKGLPDFDRAASAPGTR